MRRPALIALISALPAVVLLASLARAGDTVFVPLRWCAVDGTPAVVNPSGAPVNPYTMMPEPDTDNVLWRRHERASDQIMIPGADISYRSGITAAIRDDASFPVIPDPCPPTTQPVCQGGSTAGLACTPDGMGGAPECDAGVACATQACPAACTQGCPGNLGDIHSPTPFCQGGVNNGAACNPAMPAAVCGAGIPCASDLTEYNLAIASCTAAWDTLTGSMSSNLLGQVAVNAGVFVDIFGNRTGLKGRAQRSVSNGNACALPPTGVTMATSGAMVVIDNQNYIPADIPFEQLNERLTAHELGHTLELWHGDGTDNDTDGALDQVCDPGSDEEPTTPVNWCQTPLTFMSSTACSSLSTNMTNNQRNTARALASVYTGATTDPPGILVPGPNRGDQRSDPPLDVSDGGVDLLWLALSENSDRERTTLVHRLLAPIPEVAGQVRRYQAYLDLDQNEATGGSPADLGFDTAFAGAELVTSVEVRLSEDEFPRLLATPSVWRASGGVLVECDPMTDCADVSARVFEVKGGDDSREGGDFPPQLDAHAVVLELPNAVRGPMAEVVRVQALSERVGEAAQDRLPDPAPGELPIAGQTFRTTNPEYPSCLVTPGVVAPGEVAHVEADPLPAGETAKVFVGDFRAGAGPIDDDEVARIDFRVPVQAPPGDRLVTVGVVGTAFTADCTVEVTEGPPVRLAPVTASNPPGTEHTVLAAALDEEGEPVEGVGVNFEIVAGPNAGATGSCDPGDCTSDEFGRVFFSYASDGDTGVDQIVAMLSGSGEVSNTAHKFWDSDCNDNGIADTCDVDASGFGGLCRQVIGSGQSEDANLDGVPDECNLPPDCSAAQALPDALWPPNHKLVDVDIGGVTDPDGDPISIMVLSIMQDEALDDTADGSTEPDGFGLGTPTAELRAERQGSGDGRVYHIQFKADDGRGGVCQAEVAVCVPKSQGRKHEECVDGGPLQDSTR